MTDLEEFDAALEATPVEVEVLPAENRKTSVAIDNLVYTTDVAARLAQGESPKAVAQELGISAQTLQKRMRTAPMKNLLAIEARRVLRHLSHRTLKGEKYRDLAVAAAVFIDKEDKLNNAGMGREDRVIDKTIINQITVLVQGRRNETPGEEESSGVQELASSDLPEVPTLLDAGAEEQRLGDDGGGGSK